MRCASDEVLLTGDGRRLLRHRPGQPREEAGRRQVPPGLRICLRCRAHPVAARARGGSLHSRSGARGYGDRAWTRLESFVWYCMSVLKQVDEPQLWVVAGDFATFLNKFEFVFDPAKVVPPSPAET